MHCSCLLVEGGSHAHSREASVRLHCKASQGYARSHDVNMFSTVVQVQATSSEVVFPASGSQHVFLVCIAGSATVVSPAAKVDGILAAGQCTLFVGPCSVQVAATAAIVAVAVSQALGEVSKADRARWEKLLPGVAELLKRIATEVPDSKPPMAKAVGSKDAMPVASTVATQADGAPSFWQGCRQPWQRGILIHRFL